MVKVNIDGSDCPNDWHLAINHYRVRDQWHLKHTLPWELTTICHTLILSEKTERPLILWCLDTVLWMNWEHVTLIPVITPVVTVREALTTKPVGIKISKLSLFHLDLFVNSDLHNSNFIELKLTPSLCKRPCFITGQALLSWPEKLGLFLVFFFNFFMSSLSLALGATQTFNTMKRHNKPQGHHYSLFLYSR